MPINVKRIYDTPSPSDGLRILVERLWPRGLTREKASLDCWLKTLAPSTGLRKWYNHDPEKWEEFCRRYRAELESQTEALEHLVQQSKTATVTLIYASREPIRNSAQALKSFLEQSAF